LVVFSQGVSPNAQIAIQRRRDFAHTLLFTATNPQAAREAGKVDRAMLLERMLDEGGELIEVPSRRRVHHPDSFRRPDGRLLGGPAICRAAGRLPVQSSLGSIDSSVARRNPSRGSLLHDMLRLPSAFSQGFNLVSAAPISDFAQNLACKFMEGLYWPCPPISDFLQFAHGPFQQMNAHPKPVIILQGGNPMETEMVNRSVRMLQEVGLGAYVIRIEGHPLLSIFGFEAALNQLGLSDDAPTPDQSDPVARKRSG
jgi:hypothetical protein